VPPRHRELPSGQKPSDHSTIVAALYHVPINEPAVHYKFVHPEDDVERQTVAWEMGCDDVLTHVDEALLLSRDRPAMMDICRAHARELRDTLRKRLVGDYGSLQDEGETLTQSGADVSLRHGAHSAAVSAQCELKRTEGL
jgi:hypothetical protein